MPARLRLVPFDPDLAPTVELIDDCPLVIGRLPGCDIRLNRLRISRRHCVVRIAGAAGSEGIIEDLGSTNGTRLNGERIKSARFQHGDRIVIGPVEFLVVGDPDVYGTPRF
jgi:pSer/pThr/pTyr-binding forkhead associated (FHA) protein